MRVVHCERCKCKMFLSVHKEAEPVSKTEVLVTEIALYECYNCGVMAKIIYPPLHTTFLLKEKKK